MSALRVLLDKIKAMSPLTVSVGALMLLAHIRQQHGEQSACDIAIKACDNYEPFANEPTQPFTDALQMVGITVRGWEIPSYNFHKRTSLRYSMKTERGWVDPLHDMKTGNLKLTCEGNHHPAWKTVIEIGERHGVQVNIGACIIGQ
jgi:hypothetical protein